MNNLSDILNLSSDTVSKKENRWVIQKYIGKNSSTVLFLVLVITTDRGFFPNPPRL